MKLEYFLIYKNLLLIKLGLVELSLFGISPETLILICTSLGKNLTIYGTKPYYLRLIYIYVFIILYVLVASIFFFLLSEFRGLRTVQLSPRAQFKGLVV